MCCVYVCYTEKLYVIFILLFFPLFSSLDNWRVSRHPVYFRNRKVMSRSKLVTKQQTIKTKKNICNTTKRVCCPLPLPDLLVFRKYLRDFDDLQLLNGLLPKSSWFYSLSMCCCYLIVYYCEFIFF